MKKKSLYTLLLSAGTFLSAGLFSSCEDFLTIYPTDKISEEDFWKDKNDLENVRSAVYKQMVNSGNVTSKILVWGECRSDNFTLNKMDETAYLHLTSAILMPTESMFDWAPFYTGINYCNKVLENGQLMIESKVDPSFSEGDWAPIKAEMLAMRALYYFYLVRAYRDVPFVEKAVNTDTEAMNSRVAATPGVKILGTLIDQLEEVKDQAATNYGLTSDNKGRITKRSLRTLLADMYLWRGCMLLHQNPSYDDSGALTENGKSDNLVNEEGELLSRAETDALAQTCFEKAAEHASYVIDDMMVDYKKVLNQQQNVSAELLEQPYPLLRVENAKFSNTTDPLYESIWGNKNSTESIFELQIDGTNILNSALDILSAIENGALSAKIFTGNSLLFTTVNTVNPDKGYGKTDLRFLETISYEKISQTSWPISKNIYNSVNIPDMSDMSSTTGTSASIRSTQSGNWPIYRLSDAMLIKAEAIARSGGDLVEGFRLVNQLFARNNPSLAKTGTSGVDNEYICTRLDDDYATGKSASDLLTLVYQERQREFFAEGKRWFDLTRQAEADNSTTTALATMMGAAKNIQSRCRDLSAMYNPIYSEEMKVNGVGEGGQLKQNATWDRYTKN